MAKSYKQSIERIEEILQKIENEELDIDQLSSEVKEAARLINQCKTKLSKTQEEIETILNEIE